MDSPASPRTLSVVPGRLAICRLGPGDGLPSWAVGSAFFSLTRTPDELSVVCEGSRVPPGVRSECGWRALEVEGPIDFSVVGLLAELSSALAARGVSLFALSTFDTDYLLVRETVLAAAVEALESAGYRVHRD